MPSCTPTKIEKLAEGSYKLHYKVSLVQLRLDRSERYRCSIGARMARVAGYNACRWPGMMQLLACVYVVTAAMLLCAWCAQDGKGVEQSMPAALVMMALGRKPRTKDLGLEAAGVKLAPDGAIEVGHPCLVCTVAYIETKGMG